MLQTFFKNRLLGHVARVGGMLSTFKIRRPLPDDKRRACKMTAVL